MGARLCLCNRECPTIVCRLVNTVLGCSEPCASSGCKILLNIRQSCRICVVGCPGSGKSRFSQLLAQITGLPYISLDDFYWGVRWERMPVDKWTLIHLQLTRAPRWIIDGNYANTLKERIKAADTVILLDFPHWYCLVGVIRREAKRFLGDRQTLPLRIRQDNQYQHSRIIDLSLIRKVLTFRYKIRPAIYQHLANARQIQISCVRTREDAARLLACAQQQLTGNAVSDR